MGRNCTGAYDQVEVCDRGRCPGATIKSEIRKFSAGA